MDFFAQVTKPSLGTQETVEKQHVIWNKGIALSEAQRAHLRAINLGKKQSDETREKRTQTLKEHWSKNKKPPTRTGAKHSADSIEKMRQAKKGKVVSEETRAKLRAINLGKRQSKETIAKRNKKNVKPLMTPHGLFPSFGAVVKASGTYKNKVLHWIKKYPNDFYYVTKGE